MGSHSQLSKKKTAMSSIETLSPGVAQSGVADQYADGVAAQNWLLYIGEQENRTSNYKNFLINTLKEKKCYTILDAAAGTGVDSVMPIEEGNWMTLPKDVKTPGAGYDAIICMGNSFPHLIDDHGDWRDHKTCIQNMYDMLKPGGILVIDHRNYDYILKHGKAPKKNIYYNSQNIKSIKTQIIYEDNKPKQIVLDYKMDVEGDGDFVLSYQPWTLAEFSNLLKGIFGSSAAHTTYA